MSAEAQGPGVFHHCPLLDAVGRYSKKAVSQFSATSHRGLNKISSLLSDAKPRGG